MSADQDATPTGPAGAELSLGPVEIDWASARQANQANWDDRAALHEQSYGLDAYRSDPTHQSTVVRTDLAAMLPQLPGHSLQGLRVCHLQCHIGTDTVSLARAGGELTGLDFSAGSLQVAARLAAELGHRIRWVQGDVLEAAATIGELFDVVYTSIGVITWLPELDRWAEQVAGLLRPGGLFYLRDTHPMLLALDDRETGQLQLGYDYFGDGRAQGWEEEGTYSGPGRVAHTRNYDWVHPIGEVLNALIRAGLRIIAVDEGRTLPWQYSPVMLPRGDEFVWPEPWDQRVPCTFTVIARAD